MYIQYGVPVGIHDVLYVCTYIPLCCMSTTLLVCSIIYYYTWNSVRDWNQTIPSLGCDFFDYRQIMLPNLSLCTLLADFAYFIRQTRTEYP
ncbi:hypothetical protein BDV28DRAFT_144544 [Aspergillus coremiiformis]|uniref:Uncharacterized protein n=1 Tax=Aspergillus coremiiformis TaxID=138285 RepID=A0A5N6YS98_9EURO|nr:hypothetical protein BDV28DRAFT_144544 [Aspergillus coremiiformis]